MIAFALVLASTFSGTVERIHDADGLNVRTSAGVVVVRLAGVGAVEANGSVRRGQPVGTRNPVLALSIAKRLSLGKVVTCRNLGSALGRRVAGVCYVGSVQVNAALICSGAASYWPGSGRRSYDPVGEVRAAVNRCR